MFIFQPYFHSVQDGRGWMLMIQMGIESTPRLVQVHCYLTRTGLPGNQVAATSVAILGQGRVDGMTFPVPNLYPPCVNMILCNNSGFARYLNDGQMKYWNRHNVTCFILTSWHIILHLLIDSSFVCSQTSLHGIHEEMWCRGVYNTTIFLTSLTLHSSPVSAIRASLVSSTSDFYPALSMGFLPDT